MESPTLSTADKEAVLKMAGIDVRCNKYGNWESIVTAQNYLLFTTAFFKQTVDITFEAVCNRQ